MKYKLLGCSGLKVSEICLGTMGFGTEWKWGADKKESRAVFEAFAAAGGNFVDTANRYTGGTSEKYVGEFIARDRERFVVASKYSLSMRLKDPNAAGNSRKNLLQSLDASLKRLHTDYVDLYWVHAWDSLTPVEEVMRTLDDVVRQGKVRYAGASDTPAWVVSRANMLAGLRGWTPFSAIQVEYNLLQRTAERELLPMARELDIAVTPWAPLAGGALTGKYLDRASPKTPTRLAPDSVRLNERNAKITRLVVDIARKAGCTPAQVALSWLRAQRGVMIPIVGITRVAQIRDCLGSLNVVLTPDQMERLDGASAIEPGFPHEMLAGPLIRDILYSGVYDSIVNHRA